MLSLKLDIFMPLLDALRAMAASNSDPPPPRELQRMREELRLAREREQARALMHRLHGG
jgi:pilus assembly protein TadC